MEKITLHAADGTALAAIELKNRKRIMILPAPDFETGAIIKGLTNYSKGDILEIYPEGDTVRLMLKNHTTGTTQRAGEYSTLDSLPRLLTFQDGKYISLTVEETDEEIYSKAKAIADSRAEKHDKWTAAAIIVAVLFVAFVLVKINIVGLIVLCLCLVAL